MLLIESLFPRSSWQRIHIYRPIKHFWQRRTRGFDDSELWSLDHTIAEFAIPRLKAFKDQYTKMGYPATIKTELGYALDNYDPSVEEECSKHWQWILGELIWFLENDTWNQSAAEEARFVEASALWGKYFKHLWD